MRKLFFKFMILVVKKFFFLSDSFCSFDTYDEGKFREILVNVKQVFFLLEKILKNEVVFLQTCLNENTS